METIQCLPTDERKNVYNGLLPGHKKEWCINTCYNMDKPGKYLCQPKEANHERPQHMIPFNEMLSTGKSTETK